MVSIFMSCMLSATLQLLTACDYGGFCMCVGGVIIGVLGVLGAELLCGGCAGWRTEGSEDRTSLRGVAVNP